MKLAQNLWTLFLVLACSGLGTCFAAADATPCCTRQPSAETYVLHHQGQPTADCCTLQSAAPAHIQSNNSLWQPFLLKSTAPFFRLPILDLRSAVHSRQMHALAHLPDQSRRYLVLNVLLN